MIITTGQLKEQPTGEPQKLGIITTAIIPNAEHQPAPKGDGFKKMITTHDEPKAAAVPAPAADTPESKKGDGKKKT
jgi:hypothetical protein